MSNRDDFRLKTKKTLAERVAWKCSFPGCSTVTIGPDLDNKDKSINLGEAAHIHAAAPRGPRANSSMTPEKRKSITNGIWMCGHHAPLIDANESTYSADTLRLWKQEAEKVAYNNLKLPLNKKLPSQTTLIQIGFDLVFEGLWKYASADIWKFTIGDYIYGDEYLFKEYCSDFNNLQASQKYVVIESQGDGRNIIKAPKWEVYDNTHTIEINIGKKANNINPTTIGSDIELGENGDILVENGDFKTVSGIKNAIQKISTVLSIQKGELFYHREYGSIINKYYNKHKSDIHLFSRLMKLEISRLTTIPSEYNKPQSAAPLSFINRIIDINIKSAELINKRIDVGCKLDWANRE